MKEVIVSWMVSLMMSFSPADKAAKAQAWPGWEETAEERKARYHDIASDLYDTVYDPDVAPLYGGAKGRAKTAALVLAVAFHESGFSKDVDIGPCYRGKDGKGQRCDSGRAYCMMQIQTVFADNTTREGWTGQELFNDRKKCFTAGINALRRSIRSCRSKGPEFQFAIYASGSCDRGLKGSKELLALSQRFAARKPLPKDPAKEKLAAERKARKEEESSS